MTSGKEVMKALLSPEGKYTPITLVTSWVVITWLVGSAAIILLAIALIYLLLGAFHATMKKFERPHYVAVSIKGSILAITYAYLVTITALSTWPYLAVMDGIWNAYVLTVVVLLPCLTLCFFTIHYLHHLMVELDQKWWVSLLVGFAKASFATALVVALLIVGANYLHNTSMRQNVNALEHAQDTITIQSPDQALGINKDINIFMIGTLSYAQKMARQADVECRLCDVTITATATREIVKSSVQVTIANHLLTRAEEIINESQAVTQEDVDALWEELIAHEPYLVYAPTTRQELYTLKQLMTASNEPTANNELGGFQGLQIRVPSSPLANSLGYAILHTQEFQSLLVAHQEIHSTFKQELLQPAVIQMLYNKRNVEESLESKYARLTLVLEYTPGQP